jgi:RNA polymerase sigma-70 factor (ECF subfamily)
MILLGFVDGLSHSELAVRLAIPLGTVKSSIRRALAALKRCLEP